MERYIAVPQLALGAFIAAHAALNRIGAQPALASKWRRDNTCHPFPLTHTSPGREPGDCGRKRHPAVHAIYSAHSIHTAPDRHHRLSLAAAVLEAAACAGERVAFGGR